MNTKKECVAMLLAGGQGSRLYTLTEKTAKPAVLFGGESREPDRAADEIKAEITRLRREGIDPETFECARRTVYGRAVSALGSAGAIANQMVEAAFSGRRFGEEIELVMHVTCEDVLRRLNEQLDERFSALSVVCR